VDHNIQVKVTKFNAIPPFVKKKLGGDVELVTASRVAAIAAC